jgi:hypothetical protein
VAIPKVVAIVTVPDVVIHLSPDEYQHVLRMREDATAIPITMPNSIKRIVQAVSDLYEISFVDMLSLSIDQERCRSAATNSWLSLPHADDLLPCRNRPSFGPGLLNGVSEARHDRAPAQAWTASLTTN